MTRFTYVEFRSFKGRWKGVQEHEFDQKYLFDKLIEHGFKSMLFDAAYLIDNQTGKLIDSYVKKEE